MMTTSIPNWSQFHPASATALLQTSNLEQIRTRIAQVMPEDFAAARNVGMWHEDAGNQRPYGGSAVAILESFERVCTRNTQTLMKADNQECGSFKHTKPPQLEAVTLFQSSLLPAMSLVELATMLRRNTRCDKSTLCAATILMIRYCEMTNLKPTLHMMHRMLVAALQVATKAHSDVFLRNDAAARLCGMKAVEMSRLEVHIISGCDWRVIVTHTEATDVEGASKRINALAMVAARPMIVIADGPEFDLLAGTPSVASSLKHCSSGSFRLNNTSDSSSFYDVAPGATSVTSSPEACSPAHPIKAVALT